MNTIPFEFPAGVLAGRPFDSAAAGLLWVNTTAQLLPEGELAGRQFVSPWGWMVSVVSRPTGAILTEPTAQVEPGSDEFDDALNMARDRAAVSRLPGGTPEPSADPRLVVLPAESVESFPGSALLVAWRTAAGMEAIQRERFHRLHPHDRRGEPAKSLTYFENLTIAAELNLTTWLNSKTTATWMGLVNDGADVWPPNPANPNPTTPAASWQIGT